MPKKKGVFCYRGDATVTEVIVGGSDIDYQRAIIYIYVSSISVYVTKIPVLVNEFVLEQ